jgi:hypothetical protein
MRSSRNTGTSSSWIENSTPRLRSAGVVQVQDEGHAHRARLVVIGNQKVAANVQLAVVFRVEAGGFFDVLVHRVFREWTGRSTA